MKAFMGYLVCSDMTHSDARVPRIQMTRYNEILDDTVSTVSECYLLAHFIGMDRSPSSVMPCFPFYARMETINDYISFMSLFMEEN